MLNLQKYILRCSLAGVLMIFSHFVIAQKLKPEPTSATDAGVKLHKHGKFYHFGYNRRVKKLQQSRKVERTGQSVPKQKASRSRSNSAREARVYKKHNHFAKKENTTRSRSRSTKKP
jgi:hypothetical protein